MTGRVPGGPAAGLRGGPGAAEGRPAFGIGLAYEATLDTAARKQGAHFTPPDVAIALTRRAIATWGQRGAPMVCDPACGGGVFLVAAADELAARGHDPRTVVDSLVVGFDTDAGAVAAARASLQAWAAEHGCDATPRVEVRDGLAPSAALDGRVDVVVGNPPFRSQLGRATARDPGERSLLTARFGPAASGYVDLAALFVLRGLELVGRGGVVALVQPRSFLVARDASGVRAAAMATAHVAGCWIPGERVFGAAVDVCAPILHAGSPAGPTMVIGGRELDRDVGEVAAGELDGPTWSALHAVAIGVPPVSGPVTGPGVGPDACPVLTVGDVATATAGFRDQYYGFVGHVTDDLPPGRSARLATTAMIEPGRCRWGQVAARFAKQRWVSPHLAVDAVAAADASVGRWVDRLLVPKVLVATQTRVIEAAADRDGGYVPSTPLIAVVPTSSVGPEELTAALLAPPAAAWAHRRFGGGALSGQALKLSARQVLEVPLPTDEAAWREATELLHADDAVPDWPRIGAVLCRSWGREPGNVLRWWLDRMI